MILYYKRSQVGLSSIIDMATSDSQYIPTIYEVFDKSTETNSNKLVIIQPFNWMILNINNTLYVIDQIGAGVCGVGTTTAYQVSEDNLFQICLSSDINALVSSYKTSGKFYKIAYELNETTFTVISAINELSKTILQFDPKPIVKSKIKMEPIILRHNFTHVKSKSISQKIQNIANKIINKYDANKYRHKNDKI